MKIVCDACQAKYSISDDKVQGKVFKIRCKKCSNIIVVRGGAGAVEAPAAPQVEKETRVYDYGYEGGEAPAGDDAVWHVVINQDQVGPMTAAEVHQRFGAGEIDAETYIWREGFADWLPIAQVDNFAALAAGAPAAGPGHDQVSSMFGGGGGEEAGTTRSDPGDLFAASSAGARGSAADDDDGGDLFGGGRSAAPAAAERSQAASSAASSKMRGERNENSVLFSLNNLAQLASDKPAPASSSSSSGGAAPGHAGGEGSGLIDIRSMASAYLGGGAGPAAKPIAASSIGSIDDLPVFSGAGFSEPAVIVPTARAANNNKLMFILIGSVGVLALVAVIMIVVLLKGGKSAPAAATVAAAGSSAATAPAPGGETPAAGSAGSAAAAGSSATADNGSAAAAGSSAGSAAATAEAAGSGSGSGSATVVAVADKTPTPPTTPTAPTHAATPAPTHSKAAASSTPPTHREVATKPEHAPAVVADKKPPAAPAADSGGGGCDEVSCVLNNYDGACCAKFKKGGHGGGSAPAASKPSGGGDVPDALDRSMISDGVAKVKARVMACGDKSPAKGQVKVSVKVGADGHVSSVTVKNTPDASLGGCVAAAMQRATFAKTQNGGSFGYPFVF